jgi:rare lipoprotein A
MSVRFLLRFCCLVPLVAIAVTGCAEVQFITHAAKEIGSTSSGSARMAAGNSRENGKRYKIGKPYQIKGKWYYPGEDYSYAEQGVASWYGSNFHGKQTANGAVFDMNAITAAHRTLPLPSIVRVTNLDNGRSIKVKVNDRGPYAHNRIIDLSRKAAQLLGYERKGTALVRVEIIADESRHLANLMINGGGRNAANEAPKPNAAPSVAVTSVELLPFDDVQTAPPPTVKHQVVAKKAVREGDITRANPVKPISGQVTKVAVSGQPKMFVQAGAFSQYANAVKTKALLSSVGQVKILQVNKSTSPLFRVRVGPVLAVADADLLLQSVTQAGYPQAQIIVID